VQDALLCNDLDAPSAHGCRKDLGSLETPLTGIIVAGLSYALHDLLDWLAIVAGNLQPKPAPTTPM